MVIDHNVQTGEITEREMNLEEIAAFDLGQEIEKSRKETEAQTMAAKAAAEAKFAALGLTADDLKALGL